MVYGNLLLSEPNTLGEYFAAISRPFAADYQVRVIDIVSGTEEQYTGIKDCGGVGIYEGDIVKIPINGGDDGYRNTIVSFQEGSFCLSHEKQITWPIFDYNTVYYEVIGNIYQHKNLL